MLRNGTCWQQSKWVGEVDWVVVDVGVLVDAAIETDGVALGESADFWIVVSSSVVDQPRLVWLPPRIAILRDGAEKVAGVAKGVVPGESVEGVAREVAGHGDDAAQAIGVVVLGARCSHPDERVVGVGAVGVERGRGTPGGVDAVDVFAVVEVVVSSGADGFLDSPALVVVAVGLGRLPGLAGLNKLIQGVVGEAGDAAAGAGGVGSGDAGAFTFACEIAVGVVDVAVSNAPLASVWRISLSWLAASTCLGGGAVADPGAVAPDIVGVAEVARCGGVGVPGETVEFVVGI